jgi:hypothetical protein
MEVLYIAGGGLLVPLFIAIFAIGLLGASVAIEVGALATETVTLRSFPAAWDSRRHKRHAVDRAADRANGSSRLRLWLRFLTAPTIAYWSRWLALAAGGLIVTVVAIPALNVLLFEHCLRLALRGVEQSHGIVVTYQSAEGNWLKGRAELREARLQRLGHVISEFDLTVDRLYVDADAGKVISGEFAIESVAVINVRGQYTKIGKRNRAQSRLQQHYTIDRLTIDDAKFEFVDRSRPPRVMSVPMKLTSLEVDNYRSRWALFDVLFRSQTRGTIYGRPFEITSRAAADANESIFKVADLPLSLVGQRVRVPLGGRVDGLVDANIRTTWHPEDESTELNMHCSLLAHNLTVYMPNGMVQRAAGSAVASRVPRTMPMEFDLVMNESSFDGQTSLLATGILESIGNEASRQRRPVSSRPRNGVDRAFHRFGAGVRSLVKPGGR